MSQEIIVRLRDDYDQSVNETVATRDFSFDNVDYEIELSDENHALMLAAIQPWISVARKRKARRRRRSKHVVEPVSTTNDRPRPRKRAPEWTQQIHGWATQHGYDWDNKDVRQGVRIWSERTLGRPCRTGIIPREVLEAHYKHKLQHKGFQATES